VTFAKLYDRKTPITAADLLNDRVVPFFDEKEVRLSRVLTDRGTEYCGNPEHHDYELYLAVEDIDHSRTKTKSPQTNGIAERFHKTVLDLAPAEVYASLLDQDVYLCSIRTMYRVLAEHDEVRERRRQLRHPVYQKPELLVGSKVILSARGQICRCGQVLAHGRRIARRYACSNRVRRHCHIGQNSNF
jgi:hypothetical protein